MLLCLGSGARFPRLHCCCGRRFRRRRPKNAWSACVLLGCPLGLRLAGLCNRDVSSRRKGRGEAAPTAWKCLVMIVTTATGASLRSSWRGQRSESLWTRRWQGDSKRIGPPREDPEEGTTGTGPGLEKEFTRPKELLQRTLPHGDKRWLHNQCTHYQPDGVDAAIVHSLMCRPVGLVVRDGSTG